MKLTRILYSILFSVLVLQVGSRALFSWPGAARHSKEAAPRLALLVGINDYQVDKDWPDLRGTHRDVKLMKELLKEFGFQETRTGNDYQNSPCGVQTADSPIRTLCSAQATRRAILDAFDRHIIGKAKAYKEKFKVGPDDGAVVVFYYSGHGWFLPDDNGDESDGADETIVPADADKRGKNQIRDDEFNVRIKELSRFTRNITFIFDSCHSGTITRGSGGKSGGRKFKIRGKEIPVLTDGMDSDMSFVTISGSLPNEDSQEDYFPDPETKTYMQSGALTYHLVTQLRRNPGATYRELMNHVRNAVVAMGRSQTPQAEGDIDRPVFGLEAGKGRIPIFPNCKIIRKVARCSKLVRRRDSSGKTYSVHSIEMGVGKIVGSRTGGRIVVYGPKARELVGDREKIGSGVITAADEFSSKADIILSDSGLNSVPENAKIVLVSPNFSDRKKKVAIDLTAGLTTSANTSTDVGAKNMAALAEKLKDNAYLQPVTTTNLFSTLDADNSSTQPRSAINSDWDIAVVRSTYADFNVGSKRISGANGGKTRSNDEEGYYLSDRNGMPLYGLWVAADDADAAIEIKRALELHVRVENLRMLGNAASSLTNELDIEFVRIKGFEILSGDPIRCRVQDVDKVQIAADRNKTPQFSPSRMLNELPMDNRFYFRIWNHSDWDLYIYMYSMSSDGSITKLYPPEGANEQLTRGTTFSTYGSNQCGINYIAPQTIPGKETIKFIFTTNKIPGDLLVSPRIGAGSRSGTSPLEELLRNAATNTRGSPRSVLSVAGWTAFDFDYLVVP